MEVSLQSVEDTNLIDPERAIFNVLKATLRYPANPQAKVIKIADDINFFCISLEEGTDIGEILWEIWSVVIDIVCCIPPGHSWQDCLVLSLDSLRQRDGAILKHNKAGVLDLWKDLPNLSFCVIEKWNDPTDTDEELSEEFAKWKNLNSFVARFTSTGFAPWLNLPIWQLSMALEEPLVKAPAMECRIWVASEWIIHCADLIFEDMNSKEELDESMVRSLRTGPLCDDKPPLSVERWEFWKKRFSELVADAGSLGLDSAITGRISDALKSMDAIEN